MKIKKIDSAIAEAKRFIERANALKAAKQANYDQYKEHFRGSTIDSANCPREQGALRRASMDLTRALADLRKPN